jgi:hypothetical protein
VFCAESRAITRDNALSGAWAYRDALALRNCLGVNSSKVSNPDVPNAPPSASPYAAGNSWLISPYLARI